IVHAASMTQPPGDEKTGPPAGSLRTGRPVGRAGNCASVASQRSFMRQRFAFVAVVLAVSLCAAPSAHAVPLLTGFGGPAGCGSGDFDVEFRYNTCEWETGDASDGMGGFGGTQAQAGFDAGNGMDFVEIMGSRLPGIANHLCTSSNVGMPGIWRFAVRGGGVV